MRRWYLYVCRSVVLDYSFNRFSLWSVPFFFIFVAFIVSPLGNVQSVFFFSSILMFVDTFLKRHAWNPNKSLCGGDIKNFRWCFFLLSSFYFTASALHFVSCNRLNLKFICSDTGMELVWNIFSTVAGMGCAEAVA